MSMTEPIEGMAEPWDDLEAAAPPADALPAVAAIVPRNSLAGRSLGAVVAIMTFLASLTTGAAMVVVSAAGDWESEVGREVTIQVRPAPGHDIEGDLRKAVSEVLVANPSQVAEFHQGRTKVRQFFFGEIMKGTKGKANPQVVNKLLDELLDIEATR